MIVPNSLEFERAVRAAKRVLECRLAAQAVAKASATSSSLLTRSAREHEDIVVSYANRAIAQAMAPGLSAAAA